MLVEGRKKLGIECIEDRCKKKKSAIVLVLLGVYLRVLLSRRARLLVIWLLVYLGVLLILLILLLVLLEILLLVLLEVLLLGRIIEIYLLNSVYYSKDSEYDKGDKKLTCKVELNIMGLIRLV